MSYSYFKLRQRCRPLLKQLTLPAPFSIAALCHHLAEQRGRPLHLHSLQPEAARSGACGLLLATSTDDHIFYEQRTGRLHQEHIVLHEIGHLLFDHRTINLSEDSGRSVLLPDLDPRLVQRLLARSNYDTQQEQEAELLASLIRTRVLRREPEVPSGVLGKLEAALGVRSSRGE